MCSSEAVKILPGTTLVIGNLEGVASIVQLVLGEKSDVVLEGVDWNSLAKCAHNLFAFGA